MPNQLLATKDIPTIIHEAEKGEGDAHVTLKRSLGALNLATLGIGAIIGAGIFSLTGQAAGEFAGPAVTISFIIAGIGCALAGLCYAEFASMIPVAGSAYTYSYATMGELMAWIIGWDLVLEYAVAAATVAISWSAYLNKLVAIMAGPKVAASWLPWMLSPFSETTLKDGTVVHGIVNLPAVFIIVLMSALLMKGTKESATVNNIIVALKIAVVLCFIALGWGHMNPQNHVPYIPENVSGHFGEYGWTGILRAAGVIFFAYIGFDAVSTAAQDAKNPKRDLPLGILGSLAICTVLYILFAHVLTGLAKYSEFRNGEDSLAPVAIAIENTPYHFMKTAIICAILAGYGSVILVLLMGQSRVFFSMAKDGLVPQVFAKVNPKTQTLVSSNILFMVFTGLFAALVPGSIVGHMTSIGTLLAFVLVCVGVVILRRTKPELERGFRCPWVPVVPVLGALVCLGMMASLDRETWERLIIWLAIGLAIYFGYGKKHSKLRAGK
ncbi:amino acid permease [Prosthecobacter sp.]|uniref:amino acid permease n=1 Tax=Prosthecobacter sp. TaxID=1965333 RepID=UPI0037830940